MAIKSTPQVSVNKEPKINLQMFVTGPTVRHPNTSIASSLC